MLAHTTNRVPSLFVWMLRHESWIRLHLQQRVLRMAQRRAMRQFAQHHPQWADFTLR